ncbi:MAG: NrfD/PsrC family molybdoenzyme membrane anchor subunit [Chloroflexota bacterium]
MVLERQTSWGGGVALYMFLGGTGAGIFAAGFVMVFFSDLKWLTVSALLLGPLLVGLGLLCLLLEAGTPLQAFRLFEGLPTSWMSRGGLIQMLFVLLGLAYALPGFWFPGWLSSGAGIVLGGIALLLALALSIYHGLVLTESRGIPLWSSGVLPVLSFFIALSTGLGLLMLISPVYGQLDGRHEVAPVVGRMAVLGTAFIIGQLISVWSLMSVRPSAVYAESIRRIRAPLIAGAACLLVALMLFAGLWTIGADFRWVAIIAGVFLLATGFITRYAILKAGYYIPLRVPVPSSY